jgi:hypothetical protein
MRVNLFEDIGGKIHLHRANSLPPRAFFPALLIGTIEVEEPKKIVTRETKDWINKFNLGPEGIRCEIILPPGARNMRCVFETEE